MIDEMAMMADKMGIDIWEVVKAASTKPFGFMPFYPGPGVGGHCIPKDPLYLSWKAAKFGFKSKFIKLASDVISYMPVYVVSKAVDLIKKNGSLSKAKILVVGATYKKDIKDLRKSPALDIIDILKKKKIEVSYYDPLIPYLRIGRINLRSVALEALKDNEFDCAIIATDHTCVDYGRILQVSKLVFDARNKYAGTKSKKVFRL
jgi:UDP-N-acetyl-D-glucosamine dehydrogenase